MVAGTHMQQGIRRTDTVLLWKSFPLLEIIVGIQVRDGKKQNETVSVEPEGWGHFTRGRYEIYTQ